MSGEQDEQRDVEREGRRLERLRLIVPDVTDRSSGDGDEFEPDPKQAA